MDLTISFSFRPQNVRNVAIFVLGVALLTSRPAGVHGSVGYFMAQGYKVGGYGMRLSTQTTSGLAHCTLLCTVHPSCMGAQREIQTGVCNLLARNVFEDDVVWFIDQAWDLYIVLTDEVRHGEWTLVFRGTNDIRYPIYGTYMDPVSSQHWTSGVPMGCLLTNYQLPCNSHYRSAVLDNWDNIDKVKVTIYALETDPMVLIFNGTDTNYTNWYSDENLISSHWPDLLTESKEHFSIYGQITNTIPDERRIFYLNHDHCGCWCDKGWFVIIDTPSNYCGWSNRIDGMFPVMLYSRQEGMTNWLTDHGIADFMTIHVKYTTDP